MKQELIFAASCLVAALVLVIIFNWILQRLIRPIDDQVSRPNALFMPMHQYGLHLQTDVLWHDCIEKASDIVAIYTQDGDN
ncbi:hypothetical protein CHU98_g7642 [Xylaria longipes]|nr:hypothetical protein CHU98_g7642 [Xylaria longipes]